MSLTSLLYLLRKQSFHFVGHVSDVKKNKKKTGKCSLVYGLVFVSFVALPIIGLKQGHHRALFFGGFKYLVESGVNAMPHALSIWFVYVELNAKCTYTR